MIGKKVVLYEQQDSVIPLIKLFKSFGWKLKVEAQEQKNTSVVTSVVPTELTFTRAEGIDTQNEEEFIKLQKRINKIVWQKFLGKSRLPKYLQNLLMLCYMLFAFILSVILLPKEFLFLQRNLHIDAYGFLIPVILLINLISLTYIPIILSEVVRRIQVVNARKKFDDILKQSLSGEMKQKILATIRDLEKNHFTQDEIDRYFEKLLDLEEVGYDFPLNSFIYVTTSQLKQACRN